MPSLMFSTGFSFQQSNPKPQFKVDLFKCHLWFKVTDIKIPHIFQRKDFYLHFVWSLLNWFTVYYLFNKTSATFLMFHIQLAWSSQLDTKLYDSRGRSFYFLCIPQDLMLRSHSDTGSKFQFIFEIICKYDSNFEIYQTCAAVTKNTS